MSIDKFTPGMISLPKDTNFHALDMQAVIAKLDTQSDRGLTEQEAENRLLKYGANSLLEAPQTSFWKMLLDQFNNFLVILLIVASIISALLGEYIDAIAIMAIVILNSALGVIQERRAEQALAALRKLAAPDAHVIRDGSRMIIPSTQLVPGDLVLIEAGNFIPADLRLTEAINLRIEEAALTGESVAVQKDATIRLEADIPLGDRKNTTFMGTLVNYGRGKGIVVATGMHTQIGLIATMLQSVESEPTPLQRRLDELGKTLGWAALSVCGLVFLVAVLRGTELSILTAQDGGFLAYLAHARNQLIETFMLSVSLAIAAVPEGLPAVVTISLALGMHEMIKRHALIRRLSSVETLGSTTVICTDKTGTLTQNEMTVTQMWVDGKTIDISGAGYQPTGEFSIEGKPVNITDYPAVLTTLWVASLNNDANLELSGTAEDKITYRMVGDPTEGALMVATAKARANLLELEKAYPRIQEVPFDSARKRMITIHNMTDPRSEDFSPFYDGHKREWDAILEKGAPDEVLKLCHFYQRMDDVVVPMDEKQRMLIQEANDLMTRQALRVLGMAYRVTPQAPDPEHLDELEAGLVFTGLIGMIDPPRPEVPPAQAKGLQAGIRTIMITGDFPNTARAIAESIGLLRPGHKVLTGSELNQMDDDLLQEAVKSTDAYARVSPEHKMRIVDALRANGEVVAMTGDGVNDAPAIKRANIGIAMGITGTDVAKESADMVLTDDNYASIISAVEQGRVIYSNIRKFVFFLLSSNVAEIMIIFLATLAGLPTPLTVIQLLVLNLLTDGAPALALAMEKGDPDVMEQQPRQATEPIINRSMRSGILIQTITQTFATLTAFVIGLLWHLAQGSHVPPGVNPLLYLLKFNWQGIDVQNAETMAFATLVLCEVFRAYTVRSERESLLRIGIFSNKYMQYAVGASILMLFLVISVPFLQPIFNTHFPTAREWLVIVGLAVIPAISEEVTKAYLRWKNRQLSIPFPHDQGRSL